jgi:hypothetical protein
MHVLLSSISFKTKLAFVFVRGQALHDMSTVDIMDQRSFSSRGDPVFPEQHIKSIAGRAVGHANRHPAKQLSLKLVRKPWSFGIHNIGRFCCRTKRIGGHLGDGGRFGGIQQVALVVVVAIHTLHSFSLMFTGCSSFKQRNGFNFFGCRGICAIMPLPTRDDVTSRDVSSMMSSHTLYSSTVFILELRASLLTLHPPSPLIQSLLPFD